MDVMEDIFPLAIQVEKQITSSNKDNVVLDEDDLKDTIDKVGLEGNLSPKQIDKLKTNRGM